MRSAGHGALQVAIPFFGINLAIQCERGFVVVPSNADGAATCFSVNKDSCVILDLDHIIFDIINISIFAPKFQRVFGNCWPQR